MKHHFVKTSNHQRLMAHLRAMENRGSPEACIMLLTGEPGAGKSCNIDNWGSDAMALTLEGIPGITLSDVRNWLLYETKVAGKTKFDKHQAILAWFRNTRAPIIFDEAQHGLGNHAEVIEYLRRIAELSGVILVLVCHTSERHRFSHSNLAHIADRITAEPRFLPANREDCAIYLAELCEVGVDEAIIEKVHTQSRGSYRLLANAGRTLEAIGAKLGKTALTGADIGGVMLCEDAMRTLKRGEK